MLSVECLSTRQQDSTTKYINAKSINYCAFVVVINAGSGLYTTKKTLNTQHSIFNIQVIFKDLIFNIQRLKEFLVVLVWISFHPGYPCDQHRILTLSQEFHDVDDFVIDTKSM